MAVGKRTGGLPPELDIEELKQLDTKKKFEDAKRVLEQKKAIDESQAYKSQIEAKAAENCPREDKEGRRQLTPMDEMIEQMKKLDIETYIEWATIMMRIFKGFALLVEECIEEGWTVYGAYKKYVKPLGLGGKAADWLKENVGESVRGKYQGVREKIDEMGLIDYTPKPRKPTEVDFQYSAKINTKGQLETKGLTLGRQMTPVEKDALDKGLQMWAGLKGYEYRPDTNDFKHKDTDEIMDNKTLQQLQNSDQNFTNFLRTAQEVVPKRQNQLDIGGDNDELSDPSPSPGI